MKIKYPKENIIKRDELLYHILTDILEQYKDDVTISIDDIDMVLSCYENLVIENLLSFRRISNGLGFYGLKLNTRTATKYQDKNLITYVPYMQLKRSSKLPFRKMPISFQENQ